MRRFFTPFLLSCCLLFSCFMTSCKKFENGQSVPSYIRIDEISVNCDYYTYGAKTSKITDAWVYVDDDILGCFELPATFPILKSGKHNVKVYGGIMVNGISAARAPYTFYKPVEYKALNLVQDSIVKLSPVLSYYAVSDLKFHWSEDFEDVSLTLNATHDSDVPVLRVPVDGEQAFGVPQSSYSGKIVLPADSLHFTAACTKELDSLPTDGTQCLLELDYNCNAPFTVGLMYCENYQITEFPMLTVQATDTVNANPNRWNKIYVNVGPTCVAFEDASYFKIYLTSHIYNGYEEVIPDHERIYYIDNLKLISR